MIRAHHSLAKHRLPKHNTDRSRRILLTIVSLVVGIIWATVIVQYVSGAKSKNSVHTSDATEQLAVYLISVPLTPLEGGTEFVIHGTGFSIDHAMRVTIGDNAATNVRVLSTSTITAIAPAGKPGKATITVQRQDGARATLNEGFQYKSHIPSISSFQPTAGPIAGGTLVTVHGNNFEKGLEVWFGDTMSPAIMFIDEHTVTAVSPPGDHGDADLLVVNPNGDQSNEADFDYE